MPQSESSNSDPALEQVFTNADDAIKAFEELIAASSPAKRLLIVHGPPGIGKSTVLSMYDLLCRKKDIPVALVKPDSPIPPLDLLEEWGTELAGMGVKLDGYHEVLDPYLKIQKKIEENAGNLGKLVVGTVPALIGAVLGANPTGGWLIGAGIGVVAGIAITAALDWRGRKLSEEDRSLLSDDVRTLTQAFVDNLPSTEDHPHIVLMLDSYEHISAQEKWLFDLAQQLPEHAILVVAHEKLEPSWIAQVKSIELKEMASDDIRTFVHRYCKSVSGEVADTDQVRAIAQIAGGLPLIARLVADRWLKEGSKDLGEVHQQTLDTFIDGLLKGMPSRRKRILRAASTLPAFRIDALQAILSELEFDTLHTELLKWPYIERGTEGWSMLKSVRDVLHNWVKIESPGEYLIWHQRAAAHYQARRESTSGKEWVQASGQLLYHTLHVDEDDGVELLQELFLEAERLWSKKLQDKLVGVAAQFAFQDPQHQYLASYLDARASRTWQEKEIKYTKLLEEELDDVLRIQVLRALSEALSFQGKSEKTLSNLQQALELAENLDDPIKAAWVRLDLSWRMDDLEEFRKLVKLALEAFREAKDRYGEAVAEFEMGYYHLNRWQAQEARSAFERSKALHEKLNRRRDVAMAKERIGQAYLIEGDFSRAVARKEDALKVLEELGDAWAIAWTLDELATCYYWTGQWDLGLASDKRAKVIFAGWSDAREIACIIRQGDFYRKQGRLDKAMLIYQDALAREIEHNAWASKAAHAGQGHIYLERGQMDDALKEFEAAIAEFQSNGMKFEADLVGNRYMGDYHWAQSDAAQALDRYSAGVDVARSRNNHIYEALCLVGMCRVHHHTGQLHKFEEIASQAEKVSQDYEYHQFLADLNLLRGDIAWAQYAAGGGSLAPVIGFYRAALLDALHYNRYKLDEIVKAIIERCRGRGTRGRQVLEALLEVWKTGTELVEAEAAAREREPGDKILQVNVIDRIELAL